MSDDSSERAFLERVADVFADVRAAQPSDRPAMLDALCAGHSDVRAEVESLLAADEHSSDFLNVAATTDVTGGLGPAEGARIGPFRLCERIAAGGMGEVYAAERVDGEFSQRVAIKLIAARLAGADTLRRFRAERQILASLQHPNIVSLLDGGVTANGQPYIAMEYVDGVTITEYCRRQALALEDRVQLFRQVCAAVGFAHRNLIVHRDLKPANVLVTSDGVVKVLDFGIAKLLDAPATTGATTAIFEVPLTPNYASPEQIRGTAVTTAADVYALGVILYELLVERPPYQTAGRTLDEIVDIVVTREPIKPSAHAAPGTRSGRFGGDIDAIVMKAMAKDPARRYASADELSEDLSRFLAGMPVSARAPSMAYVMGKLVARHRAAFATIAATVGLLVLALAGAVWQARVAARERERAVRRFHDVRELAGALIFKIHDEVAPLAGSTPVRQSVIAEGLKFLEKLESESAGDATLQLELSSAYARIGEVQGKWNAANLGDSAGALRSYEKALALASAAARSNPPPDGAVAAVVTANLAIADFLSPGDGLNAVKAAYAAAQEQYRRRPENLGAQELLARASFFVALRMPDDSLPFWLESDRLYQSLLAADPGNPNRLRNVALTQKYIGGYYARSGDLARALEHDQNALARDEARLAGHPDDASALADVAIDIGTIASIQSGQHHNAAAIESYKRSLQIRERIYESDPKNAYARGRLAFMHDKLAELYWAESQLELARQHGTAAVQLNEPLVPTAPMYKYQQVDIEETLANIETSAGRRDKACSWWTRAQADIRDVNLSLVPAGEGRKLLATIEQEARSCSRRLPHGQ